MNIFRNSSFSIIQDCILDEDEDAQMNALNIVKIKLGFILYVKLLKEMPMGYIKTHNAPNTCICSMYGIPIEWDGKMNKDNFIFYFSNGTEKEINSIGIYKERLVFKFKEN